MGPGPHLIKKRIYRAAVSQRLRTLVEKIALTTEVFLLKIARSKYDLLLKHKYVYTYTLVNDKRLYVFT